MDIRDVESKDMDDLKEIGGYISDSIISARYAYFRGIEKFNRISFVPPVFTQLMEIENSSEYDRLLTGLNVRTNDVTIFAMSNGTGDKTDMDHWYMIASSKLENTIYVYDSLIRDPLVVNNAILNFCDKLCHYFGMTNADIILANSAQQRLNDCGIFLLLNTEQVANQYLASNTCNLPTTITQADVIKYRTMLLEHIKAETKANAIDQQQVNDNGSGKSRNPVKETIAEKHPNHRVCFTITITIETE